MDGAARLRLTDQERQTEFPWADAGARRALAIPPADLDLWRGRKDVIRRPGFIALRFSILTDPRWAQYVGELDRIGIPAEWGWSVLTMTAARAMIGDPPGVLGLAGRVLSPADVRSYWRVGESGREIWERVIQTAYRTGWLTWRALDDETDLWAYRPVEESKDHSVGKPYAPVRKEEDGVRKTYAVDGRRRTDVYDDVDDEEGDARGRLRAKSDDDDQAAGERHPTTTEPPTTSRGARHECRGPGMAPTAGRPGSDTPPRRSQPPRETITGPGRNAGAPGIATVGGMPGMDDDGLANLRAAEALPPHRLREDRHLVERAAAELATALSGWRVELGLAPYPSDSRDYADFARATATAAKTGRFREFVGLLRARENQWPDSGAGFRKLLREAGFLPAAKAR